MVKHIVKLNQTIGDKKEISLRFDAQEDQIEILIDASKIQQAIENLITNAIKYSTAHTIVDITVEASELEVMVTVKDQGIGISEADQALLFRPFQVTQNQATEGEKSSGLGLYIVKRIIEAHNGRIWVQSNIGKGTTFQFCLPKEI